MIHAWRMNHVSQLKRGCESQRRPRNKEKLGSWLLFPQSIYSLCVEKTKAAFASLHLGKFKMPQPDRWDMYITPKGPYLPLLIFTSYSPWGKCMLSHVQLFATPWTVVPQNPHSWNFPHKNTGVGCRFLLQGIFLTQVLNLHLCLPCISRQILYHCTTWEAPHSWPKNNCLQENPYVFYWQDQPWSKEEQNFKFLWFVFDQ